VVRSAQGALIGSLAGLRQDLLTIIRAGVDAAGVARALQRALADATLHTHLTSRPLHVIAAGKAAASMAPALFSTPGLTIRSAFAVGTHRHQELPALVEWHQGGHPLPDERSVAAAGRVLEIARGVGSGECLVLLISGGTSALLACPLEGVTLQDKQQVVAAMLRGGADIHALNTVRKHLSAVKGGRLAGACRGTTLTLAVSDVVGDDLAVIGSGPGVPDPSTWADAARAIGCVPSAQQPASVRALMKKGVAGELADTPKPGDPAMARVEARVIASRLNAVDGARLAAEQLGYRTFTIERAVTGEARVAAAAWFAEARQLTASGPRVCVVSAGETTVRVTGTGRGGRNQEFALSLARALAAQGGAVAAASVGTDGIDGPTDAAGAVVDATTLHRAAEHGLDQPERYLEDNNSYFFFSPLGDLIKTGPTDTNVGDLQVLLHSV
jgi:glycerate 2-kinase